MTDVHVHMGFFRRIGRQSVWYYSPRRIFGLVKRCGVKEFIVSSTSAQIKEIGIADMIAEAVEMKRVAGRLAHIFFWLSWHLFEEDRAMKWLNSGLFEGVKFHELETPWIGRYSKELMSVLGVIERHGLPVQFHTGDNNCRVSDLLSVAKQFPGVRFNFSHCKLMSESASAIYEQQNVFADTAGVPIGQIQMLKDYAWDNRLLYGSDIPTIQAYEDVSLTDYYRREVLAFSKLSIGHIQNFRSYLYGKSIRDSDNKQ